MNIKIIGLGKCGSRLCYDFFAYIRGLPTAYEIRNRGQKSALRLVLDRIGDSIAFNQWVINWRRSWQELTGTELLKGAADYAIVDSDMKNNEITGFVTLRFSNGEFVFPGRSYQLDHFSGGCQYHIISENVTAAWNEREIQQSAPTLLSLDGADIVAFAFSVGGGTGGGAAPQMALKFKNANQMETKRRQVHHMAMAILPQSDQELLPNERIPAMDSKEKYSTGRFFCGWYGKRNQENNTPYLSSAWLVSNDLLRLIAASSGRPKANDPAEALNNKALSLVNNYIASALCTLCNASSPGTHSASNIDPKELNGFLDGAPFISGFAFAKVDGRNDDVQDAVHLQKMFKNALCNTQVDNGLLQGVSVPVNAKDLSGLLSLFDQPVTSTVQLIALLRDLGAEKLPVEFRTAREVVMLYGQPQDLPSISRQQAAASIVKQVFKNSECSWSHYRHSGTSEYLLLLIINPFVPVIVDCIFDYISRSWLKDESISLKQTITEESFNESALARAALNLESLPSKFLGESTVETVKQLGKLIPFEQKQMVGAVRELHSLYHHKLRKSQTW